MAGRKLYRGVIFDFNGVLWWDTELQEESWREFSARLRGWPLTQEEMAVHMHGRNSQHTMSYLTGRPVAGDELLQLIQQKESIYQQLCLDQGPGFRLSPGAVELLDYLVDQAIPHTIATASEKNNLDFFVRNLRLDCWFAIDTIVYDDGRRPGKPDPSFYFQAAQNLGLPPGACVVVEDSRSGLQAAGAAGIGHVIALGPASALGALAQLPGVNQVIESLSRFPRDCLG